MSYYPCSGNFSSCSLGDHLRYSSSSCGSSYLGDLVYSTDRCSPRSCRLGSSLWSGFYEPSRCFTACGLSSPCHTSCYRPRTSMIYSPCCTTYAGSLGSRSSRGCSLGYGSRSCYTLGFGSHGFRPLGYEVYAFPWLSHRSGFCRPSCFASRSCQSLRYRPICGSAFYWSACGTFRCEQCVEPLYRASIIFMIFGRINCSSPFFHS